MCILLNTKLTDYITSFISILNPDINIVSAILWLNAFTLFQIA